MAITRTRIDTQNGKLVLTLPSGAQVTTPADLAEHAKNLEALTGMDRTTYKILCHAWSYGFEAWGNMSSTRPLPKRLPAYQIVLNALWAGLDVPWVTGHILFMNKDGLVACRTFDAKGQIRVGFDLGFDYPLNDFIRHAEKISEASLLSLVADTAMRRSR